MNDAIGFAVVSGLLYPFGIVLAAVGLVSWFSRFRAYRELLQGRSSQNWLRDGCVSGCLLCLLCVVSFRPLPHFATVLGCLAGFRVVCVASVFQSVLMLVSGWPPACVIVCGLAGPLGAGLRVFGSWGRGLTMLSAAIWPPLAWFSGWIPPVLLGHLQALSAQQLPWMFFGSALVSALQAGLLLWSMEYLAQREARRTGQLLWRVVSLFDGVMTALRSPLPNRELCRALGEALETECVLLGAHKEIEPSEAREFLYNESPLLELAFSSREPRLYPSSSLLRTSFPKVVLIPLYDGEQTLAVLVLPVHNDHPLADSDPALLKGLSVLLTGELSRQRVLRQQVVLGETRYRMLAAQIQPHFLFNSLTTVASLTLTDPDRAHDLVVDLADALRPKFAPTESMVLLVEEMRTIGSYLAIEKARLGERLEVALQVPEEAKNCLLPPMLLQPLIENAVRHGNAYRSQNKRAKVGLKVTLSGKELWFEISDNGSGFSSSAADGELKVTPAGHGVGLANVRERLQTVAGQECCFEIDSSSESGTRIRFRLPVQRQDVGSVA